MLSADDPLPIRPRRVLVAGTSGSGKTTLARRLGAILDLPHTEIDALYHGAGWIPRPSFQADVEALTRQPRWVTEWQYSPVRPLLARRAELMVWLDLPFPVVLARVVRRTVRRRLRHEELWNGNREGPLHRFFTDPEHIVRWSIRSRHTMRHRMPGLRAEHPHLLVVRLCSAREVEDWLRHVVEPLA